MPTPVAVAVARAAYRSAAGPPSRSQLARARTAVGSTPREAAWTRPRRRTALSRCTATRLGTLFVPKAGQLRTDLPDKFADALW